MAQPADIAKKMKSSTVGTVVAPEDAAERARVEEIFAKFDTNQSGVLEKEQGIAFLRVELEHMTGAEPTEDELERNFAIIDEDASGTLDKEEVLKFLKGFALGFTLRNLMRAEAGDEE